jgi:PKD repeat protein
MKKFYFLPIFFFLCCASFSLTAQKKGSPALEKVLKATNVQFLNQYALELNQEYERRKKEAHEMAEKMGWPTRVETEDYIMELVELDELGAPVYYHSENRRAAETVSTTLVWTGGGHSLEYDGQDMIVGEWDGGAVRVTHREFQDRAIQRDGATSLSDHATHVGGTLIGAGIDPEAKGMAHQATLWAHDWTNDAGEMAARAAEGLLISNHSYGTIAGWRNNTAQNRWEWYGNTAISEVEDWAWGFYRDRSVTWDNIARNAPYYLIVKSAGNDRGRFWGGTHFVRNQNNQWVESNASRNADGGEDGHDCLSNQSNAKNILTVGAVNRIIGGYQNPNQVVMSSFSGWGPTDDGRIKPDVVANGVGLFSAADNSNSAYSTKSGTSMSAPSASGSMLLMQQAYEDINEEFMLSATLKALTIHTADEAGQHDGPDYVFGWGLINTKKAVDAILNTDGRHRIQELSLSEAGLFRDTINLDGTIDFRATMCWTDLPGNPAAPSLNPTDLMLVNDLDIRLRNVDTDEVFFPWVLDPANPSNPATTGDNFRDNVEQIWVAEPEAGTYVIEVTHKNSIVGSLSQNFSVIYSGISNDLPPIAGIRLDVSRACVDEVFELKDFSQNLPEEWTWTITPETFEFVNDTDENSQNPQVIFTEEGFYSITLLASNEFGSNERVFEDAIEVFFGNEIQIELVLDNYGSDITWEIVNENGAVLATGTDYPDDEGGEVIVYDFCLPDDCYTFNVYDSFGDGLCCDWGEGSISVSVNGNIFIEAAEFESLFSEEFCAARVYLDEFEQVCGSQTEYELTGGFPEGGTYTFNGEVTSSINPNEFDPGIYAVTYTFDDFTIEKSLEIIEAVTPSISISSVQTQACPNALVNILSSRQNAGQTPTYEWTINGSPVGGNAPALVTLALTSSDDVIQVSMTSSLTCVTQQQAVSNELSVDILPRIPLNAEIDFDLTSICANQEAELNINVTTEIPNVLANWNIGGTVAGSGLTLNHTFVNSSGEPQTQNIIATVNTSYLCPLGPAAITLNKQITVNPAPETPVLSFNESVLSTETEGVLFRWFLEGDFVQQTDQGNFVPQESGNYTVEVENSFGCSTISESFFVEQILTGINEISGLDFSLFPNPNKGKFVLETSSEVVITQAELVDLSGKVIERISAGFTQTGQHSFDFSGLASGVYFLRINTDNGLSNLKVVID